MEELDIPAILKAVRQFGLSPIERVLAAHTGTVQLLLSLWWDEPVTVELCGPQSEENHLLRREVELKLVNSGTVVAKATSYIDLSLNSAEIIADVRAGKHGIGQIALHHRINTRREIKEISVKDGFLYRRYLIQGPDLHYEIHEYFPRDLYQNNRP